MGAGHAGGLIAHEIAQSVDDKFSVDLGPRLHDVTVMAVDHVDIGGGGETRGQLDLFLGGFLLVLLAGVCRDDDDVGAGPPRCCGAGEEVIGPGIAPSS